MIKSKISLPSIPTTLEEYGITDAYNRVACDARFDPLGSSGSVTNIPGNAGTATKLQTARNINGVLFDGTVDITISAVAAAGALTGTTLAIGVVTSSLTSAAGGTFGTAAFTAASAYDVAGAAAAVTPATLGLVIGTNVLAYRTFGTAANSAATDFDPAGAALSVARSGQAFAFFCS
jgi:hypothetical protein